MEQTADRSEAAGVGSERIGEATGLPCALGCRSPVQAGLDLDGFAARIRQARHGNTVQHPAWPSGDAWCGPGRFKKSGLGSLGDSERADLPRWLAAIDCVEKWSLVGAGDFGKHRKRASAI